MRRLTAREVPLVKKAILDSQGGACPLCLRPLTVANSALDHDHVTGQVRGVLCKPCNGAEGKIKNIMIRWGRNAGLDWLGRLIMYWIKYRDNPRQFLYHLHRDEDEKRVLRNMRARKARAKKKEAK